MATWNVKEISKRAKVSIRTLHYYDKIGLLKPSARLPNGYRVYMEKDLRKLEQIVALKFCGFSLVHIRRLLIMGNEGESISLLNTQLKLLREEVSHIQEAQAKLLAKVISELETTKEVNWQSMIEFIQEYERKVEQITASDFSKAPKSDDNLTL